MTYKLSQNAKQEKNGFRRFFHAFLARYSILDSLIGNAVFFFPFFLLRLFAGLFFILLSILSCLFYQIYMEGHWI